MNWGPEATPRTRPTLCSGLTSPCHSRGDCEDSTFTQILASPSLQGGVLSTFLRERPQERMMRKRVNFHGTVPGATLFMDCSGTRPSDTV